MNATRQTILDYLRRRGWIGNHSSDADEKSTGKNEYAGTWAEVKAQIIAEQRFGPTTAQMLEMIAAREGYKDETNVKLKFARPLNVDIPRSSPDSSGRFGEMQDFNRFAEILEAAGPEFADLSRYAMGNVLENDDAESETALELGKLMIADIRNRKKIEKLERTLAEALRWQMEHCAEHNAEQNVLNQQIQGYEQHISRALLHLNQSSRGHFDRNEARNALRSVRAGLLQDEEFFLPQEGLLPVEVTAARTNDAWLVTAQRPDLEAIAKLFQQIVESGRPVAEVIAELFPQPITASPDKSEMSKEAQEANV